MKNQKRITLTLEEVTGQFTATAELSKKFEGFKVADTIRKMVSDSAEAMASGNEIEAIHQLVEADHGLKNLLTGFFRNSPKFFTGKLRELEGYDRDIIEVVEKAIRYVVTIAAVRTDEIDLMVAAEAYAEVWVAFRSAVRVQDNRVANRLRLRREEEERKRVDEAAEKARLAKEAEKRRVAKEAADKKRAEEQRAAEARRRNEKAQSLRDLAATL